MGEKPLPSRRLARVCTEKGCIWRAFGDPDASCPDHGPRKTVVQANGKYLGKRVP